MGVDALIAARLPATSDSLKQPCPKLSLLAEVRATRVAHTHTQRMTLHRPEKLNAVNVQLLQEAGALLKTWSRDPAIGAIVVTGSGRAFCAGGDVSMMAQEGDPSTLEQKIDGLRDMQGDFLAHLYSSPKVTIASVNGFAMGAGLRYRARLRLAPSVECREIRNRLRKGRLWRRFRHHLAIDPLCRCTEIVFKGSCFS